MGNLRVSQISIGRFHHFHLARQLERHGMLEAIFTGYPRFKLKDEQGIPREKIRTFPWLQSIYMRRSNLGLGGRRASKELAWWAHESLDWHASRNLGPSNILIALSASGSHSGAAMKRKGGLYICDRGSSHIRYQDDLLREEYARWKLPFEGVDRRKIAKEETEYAIADRISVPSEFVRRSFLQLGMPAEKLLKLPYGARLDRFKPAGVPDKDRFDVLFVGSVSIRKGILYLLEAFAKLQHPHKQLTIIGAIHDEIRPLLAKFERPDVRFLGTVPNAELSSYYSKSHVFVLPSIEEGLSMVQGEAIACGCPVIASTNTGGEDLFEDGREGFIVPIRSSVDILKHLEQLAQDEELRKTMASAALERVRSIGGWNAYGDAFAEALTELQTK